MVLFLWFSLVFLWPDRAYRKVFVRSLVLDSKRLFFFGSQTAVIKNKSQHRLALGVFESFSSNWGPGLKLKIFALAADDIEVLKGEAGFTYAGGKI